METQKTPEHPKAILRRRKAELEESGSPDFRLYYKTIVIKVAFYKLDSVVELGFTPCQLLC